ncbi:MFS transporter [Phaeacidiphilus oryzae]|uniref:MFS transporter n=1 Tax=Phaeacidiphilus oryzae TaxID=348818 RepID=UPI00068BA79B|nr:MFS transporter [Phaeacidiphilus oryzae]
MAAEGRGGQRARTPGWRAVALLVAGAFFMENLDGTIISTAAPRMAVSLAVRPADINVAMTAYLLTVAACIPASGWAVDRFGARRVFTAAVGVFTLASALCTLSGGLGELTAARVVQGIGGAMMVPVGRLVVLRDTEKSELLAAVAYLTWPALLAPVIAPTLGGLLSAYASWRWIFALNLPLGAAALIAAFRLMPRRDPGPATGAGPDVGAASAGAGGADRLDWAGFGYSGAGLAIGLYGVEGLGGTPIDWTRTGPALAAGALLLGLAVRHLARAERPLVDLRVMRLHSARVSNLGGSLFRTAISAVPFLLPLLFELGYGWSPTAAGLMLMAVFAGNIGIKPLTSPILRRWGFKRVLVGSNLAAAGSIALCAGLGPHTPLAATAAVLFAGGVFRSIGFTAYNGVAFAEVPAAQMSAANTLNATLQQLAGGVGVAAGALALRAGQAVSDGHPAGGAVGLAPFRIAFLLVALLPLVGAVEVARLNSRTGATVTGHAERARPAGSDARLATTDPGEGS